MKGVQSYELFGGIAHKNHAFSFFHFHYVGKHQTLNYMDKILNRYSVTLSNKKITHVIYTYMVFML